MALNVCCVCVCVLCFGVFLVGFFPFFLGSSRVSAHVKLSLLVRCVMLSSKTVPGCRLFFGVQCTYARTLAWGFLFPLLFIFQFSFTYIIMDHYLLGNSLSPFNKAEG